MQKQKGVLGFIKENDNKEDKSKKTIVNNQKIKQLKTIFFYQKEQLKKILIML